MAYTAHCATLVCLILGKRAQLAFLLVASVLVGCSPKVNYAVDRKDHWHDQLNDADLQRYNLHLKIFHELVFEAYSNRMSLLDENGKVTRETVLNFASLFTENATVWNDIHHHPHPVSPTDYGAFVRHYMFRGVNAKIAYYGDAENALNDMRLHSYYLVGGGQYEYFMHRAVEKRIFYGLNEEMTVESWGPQGKTLLLDFVVYINDSTNQAKIAYIKPLLN